MQSQNEILVANLKPMSTDIRSDVDQGTLHQVIHMPEQGRTYQDTFQMLFIRQAGTMALSPARVNMTVSEIRFVVDVASLPENHRS
jgi:hypothetical protein